MTWPFQALPEEAIRADAEEFRFRKRPARGLAASVERAGIRTPLLVQRRGDGWRIVSGWGRWSVRPAARPLPCFLLPEELEGEALWDLVLRDNDAWSALDAARVLERLLAIPGLSAERVAAEKMPLLGLRPSRDLLRGHLELLRLGPAALEWIEEEGLPLRKARVLARLPADAVDALKAAASSLRMTFQEAAEAIELVADAAGPGGAGAGEIAGEIIARAAAESRGRKDAFRAILRRCRYPERAALESRLEELRDRIRLPVPSRIEWDPTLERPGLELTARIEDRDALERFAAGLEAQRPALAGLLEAL